MALLHGATRRKKELRCSPFFSAAFAADREGEYSCAPDGYFTLTFPRNGSIPTAVPCVCPITGVPFSLLIRPTLSKEACHGTRPTPHLSRSAVSLLYLDRLAVIDNTGYIPKFVKMSADLLAPNTDYCLYVSSISAYASFAKPNDIGSPTGVQFGYGAKFPAKYQNALFIHHFDLVGSGLGRTMDLLGFCPQLAHSVRSPVIGDRHVEGLAGGEVRAGDVDAVEVDVGVGRVREVDAVVDRHLAAVDGVDALFIGPADLSLTLGCTPKLVPPALPA